MVHSTYPQPRGSPLNGRVMQPVRQTLDPEPHIRVLVIDDDPDAVRLLKTRLEHTGRFTVMTASSGQAGLELARDMEPDLIVCDIYMPGMGGADVAAALAADDSLRDVPLLFLSALVKPDDIRASGGRIGGWPMASKEEPIHSIVRRIDGLLHRYRR